MRPVVRFTLGQRVLFNLVFVLLMVAGAFSVSRLSVERYPEVNFGKVIINTIYPGASPRDVEALVTIKIEEALDGLEHVELIRSNSVRERSTLLVKFQDDTDYDGLYDELRFRVLSMLDELPSGVDPPTFDLINTSFWLPVVSVNLVGERSNRALTLMAEELQVPLSRIPGVIEAEVVGEYQREFHVYLDPHKLNAQGVSFEQVAGALEDANLTIPAGDYKDGSGEFVVRVDERFRTREQVVATVVRRDLDGSFVTLEDLISEAYVGFRDPHIITSVDGRDCVTVKMLKAPDGNALDIHDAGPAHRRRACPQPAEAGRRSNPDSGLHNLHQRVHEHPGLEHGRGYRAGQPDPLVLHGHAKRRSGHRRHPLLLPGDHDPHGPHRQLPERDHSVLLRAGVRDHRRRRHRGDREHLPPRAGGHPPGAGHRQRHRRGDAAGDLRHGHHGGGLPAHVDHDRLHRGVLRPHTQGRQLRHRRLPAGVPVHPALALPGLRPRPEAGGVPSRGPGQRPSAGPAPSHRRLIRLTMRFRYLSLSLVFVTFVAAVAILGVSIAGIAPLVRIKFFPDDYTLYYAFVEGPANTPIEITDEKTREIARFIMDDGPGYARSAAGFAGFVINEDYEEEFGHNLGTVAVPLPERKERAFDDPLEHLDAMRERLKERFAKDGSRSGCGRKGTDRPPVRT